jgi:hypothetical protein
MRGGRVILRALQAPEVKWLYFEALYQVQGSIFTNTIYYRLNGNQPRTLLNLLFNWRKVK